jgi:hypothetical protein
LRPEDRSERQLEVEGFPVRVISYRLEGRYHVTVDNVEPGARIARAEGATRAEAEAAALADAARRLVRTRRFPLSGSPKKDRER